MWLESAQSTHAIARSHRLERWSSELQAYEFQVAHHPGTCNVHADTLQISCISSYCGGSPVYPSDFPSSVPSYIYSNMEATNSQ